MEISFTLFGLVYLALVLWSIVSIAQSHHGILGKALWLIVVLAFQPLGAIIWFFLGPRPCPTARLERYHRAYGRY